MKHLRFGLLLLSAAGVWACNSDPTDSLRETGTRLIADPTVIYLDKGASTTLTVQRVDEQGTQLPGTFEATSDNGNVTVVVDTTYLTTTNGAKIQTSERFTVKGLDYVQTAVHVQAGSDTLTVPVNVVPKTTIAATFSDTIPPLGATITITAPPGISFSPTSTVSFGAAALAPAEVVVAGDGSSISLVPPPNLVSAPAEITDVVSVGSPNLTFTNTTTQGLTTPAVVDLPATPSTLTPAVNQAVTLTFSGATAVSPSDTTLLPITVGTTPAVVLSRTATTINFLPSPGAFGPITVSGVVLNNLPQFELTLSTPDTMAVDTLVPTLGGTAAVGTAPTIAAPANPGEATSLFDAPDFTATIDHFYKFNAPAAGDYVISLDWNVGSDLDLIVCDASCSADSQDFQAATGDQPQVGTYTLTAGTHTIWVEDFGEDAAGATVQITIQR